MYFFRKFLISFKSNSHGQSLVELLIALGLTSIMLPALLTGYISSQDANASQSVQLQAVQLGQEAVAAVDSVKDKGWSNIATNGIYHPAISGNSSWTLASGSETIGNFTRSISITDTYRDTSGNVANSGNIDYSTKKVTITVSWTTPTKSSYSTTFYLSRYLGNTTNSQNSTNFQSGIFNNTVLSSNQITLATGTGNGDWCSPSTSILSTFDLPQNGVAQKIYATSTAAAVTENSKNTSFVDLSITNTGTPSATLVGSGGGYNPTDIFADSGYIYLSTSDTNKAVAALSKSNYAEVAVFNPVGSNRKTPAATSIFVQGNIGFTTIGTNLYSFDLTTKSGNLPQLGSTTITNSATAIYIVGSYIYVAENANSTQLQIFQFSPDGKTLSLVSSLSLTALGAQAITVSADGNRAYIVTANSKTTGWNEFFVINTQNKQSPTLVSSYNETTGMDPLGVAIAQGGTRAIMIGTHGNEYQVINLDNESNPTECGQMSDNSGIYGVAVDDINNRAYIISGQTKSEFEIIQGDIGNKLASSGTFESTTFDAGSSVAFNRFDPVFNQPTGTQMQYQVAVANPVSGNCTTVSSYTFVGPNGDPSQFFASGSAIPVGNFSANFQNPGQCYRYRVYFTASQDLSSSPSLSSMTTNFSP